MSEIREQIQVLLAADDLEGAWSTLFAAAREELDYAALRSLCRLHRKLAETGKATPIRKRPKVALLGSASTELIEAPLSLCLESLGLGAEIHRADFNTLAQEMMDPESDTARFEPEVAILVATPASIPSWPEPGESRERVDARVDEVCAHWLGLCEQLHRHSGCEILLDNFHALPTRALGHLGAKTAWDRGTFLRRVNLELGLRAPDYVHIHDVDALSSQLGTRTWFDARYWHHAKQPMSFECLPAYVRSLSRLVGGLFGVTRKCLVVDLDNTLWGGVIGDDGLDGIQIGEGDAVGEAFKAFQAYLLELKQRGILLAVCSKNEEENALEPFEKHPEMLLRRDDFVAFQANWEPKPDNIREIARALNIGLDSLVFVDDNPAERAHVRQRLPEVHVVELTEDPADYPMLVDRADCFQIPALSAEDGIRTQQYQANAERERHRESVTDYGSYLGTLEQRAIVAPFQSVDLDRITQLINKSNQFNLTTQRHSRSEVEAMATAPERLNRTIRLKDRFGDNGLICVFSAFRDGDAFEIDLWLMSCRVLKRGVENYLMNRLVPDALAAGASELRGVYLPTAKNGLVREHYPKLGFTRTDDDEDGPTRWRLPLADFEPFDVSIETEEAS